MGSSALRDAAGATLDEPCEEDASGEGGFTEMLTQVSPVGDGVWLEGVTLTYREGDETHTLTTSWVTIACGPAVLESENCESPGDS